MSWQPPGQDAPGWQPGGFQPDGEEGWVVSDLTVDLWQDFDFTTLDTTNLDANDHFVTTGRWSIIDASSKLSTSTSGEKFFEGSIGGEGDDGTRGLAYDCNGGAQAYLQFAHPVQRTQLSWGFYFKITGSAFFSSFGEYDLCRNSTDLGAGPSLFKILDDTAETRFHLFVPSTYSTGIPIEEDHWYWCTGKHVKNSAVVARLYDGETGDQIGSELSIAVANENLTAFLFGPIVGGPNVASALSLEDLVLDWTNAAFPLGPPLAPEVPDVVGETEAAGTATLEAEGFVVSVDTAYSDSVIEGSISAQSPEGGETATYGSTVTITVSLGPEPAPPADDSSGGWAFLIEYESERRRKEERRKKRKEFQEETDQIVESVDKSIAQLLRKQEAKDDRKEEIDRLRNLVRSGQNIRAASQYSQRVGDAYKAAIEKGTFASLEKLERELKKASEEEDFMSIVAMILLSHY